MKSSLSFALGLGIFLLGSSLVLEAEDWTTTDGKVYQNVTVVKSEPDAVTITDRNGGALVPLVKLPPDLQKRFNYDPVKAKAAADARVQSEAKNAVILQAEMNQARDQKQAAMIESDPRFQRAVAKFSATHNLPTGPYDPPGHAEETSSTPTDTVSSLIDPILSEASATTTKPSTPPIDASSDTLALDPSDSRHHSMDSLVDIHSRLKDDHPSPNRHTAASLLLASSYLMPDPLDPNHHSTDELLKSASDMSKPSDPTHHSMDSLLNGDTLARP